MGKTKTKQLGTIIYLLLVESERAKGVPEELRGKELVLKEKGRTCRSRKKGVVVCCCPAIGRMGLQGAIVNSSSAPPFARQSGRGKKGNNFRAIARRRRRSRHLKRSFPFPEQGFLEPLYWRKVSLKSQPLLVSIYIG